MSDVAIRVENLSKRYRIGTQEEKQDTLVGAMLAFLKQPGRNLQRLRRLTRFAENGADEKDVVWALRDVSFEVKQGEVIGVIGRNGAGKSTLLKILSRITYPTTGRVELHGRVSSLLEVGTGFHPELTGRENVYLNGTILGMRKKEIDRKFREIIDFSGVEKFVDTPVKHYSSGMRVRLAFSVAAHLEPEILLVDEVLAVGDAEFQKKCLGKMKDVAHQGRTIFFVSHNMQAILSLCSQSIWFDNGRVKEHGATSHVVQNYLRGGSANNDIDLTEFERHRGSKKTIMRHARLFSKNKLSTTFCSGGEFAIEVECETDQLNTPKLSLGFALTDGLGQILFASNMNQYDATVKNHSGHCKLRATVEKLPLNPGTYGLNLYLGNGSFDIDILEGVTYFEVIWDTQNQIAHPPQQSWGSVYTDVKWEAKAVNESHNLY